MTGLPPRRSQRAKSRSSGVSPARASMTNSATSASARALSVCARMRPPSVSGAASSSPAGSMIRKLRSAIRPSPWRRSRVTPGVSSTSARGRPASRLNRVDLPTFGRPTIATVTLISDWLRAARLSICGEICVVGQQVKSVLGDDRSEKRAARQRLATDPLPAIGRDRHQFAKGGKGDQPVSSEHRAGPADRIRFRLLVLVAPELMHPADLALLARQADKRVVARQHKDKFAGDPGAVAAGDVLLPDALAAAQIDRRHAAAVADGKHTAMIDNRAAADIGKPRNRIDAAR